MLYMYVILILVCETIAIAFLKSFSLNLGWYYFLLGLLFYGFVAVLLTKSFKYEEMAIVNVLWSAFSIIFVVLVGYFYFKEEISITEIVGIGLVISGVIIVKS